MELPSPGTAKRMDVSVCVCVRVSKKVYTLTHLSVLHLILQGKQHLEGAAGGSWTPAAIYKTHHLHQDYKCTTASSRDVLSFIFYSLSPVSSCRWSLKPSFFPLHQVSCCSLTCTDTLLPPENEKTLFTFLWIFPAPSMTSISFKPDTPKVCGPFGLLNRGPWHLAKWLLVVCSQPGEGILFQRQRRDRFVEALKP